MAIGLLNYLRKLKYSQKIKKLSPFYSVGNGSILMDAFNLRLDFPKESHKYLKIGKDSFVNGSFIFESESGFVEIGNNCAIGNSQFICNAEIVIEDNVTIAWNSIFYTHNSHSLDYKERQKDSKQHLYNLKNGKPFSANKNWNTVASKPIKICNNAWVGMNCVILKGVTVGEGAIVGACSVVTKDVPAWSVVAGNPAKVMRLLK